MLVDQCSYMHMCRIVKDGSNLWLYALLLLVRLDNLMIMLYDMLLMSML